MVSKQRSVSPATQLKLRGRELRYLMPKSTRNSLIEILRNSQIFNVGSVVHHILKLERQLPLISFTRLAQDFGKFIELHWTRSPHFRGFSHYGI